jgi:hypothetical protein
VGTDSQRSGTAATENKIFRRMDQGILGQEIRTAEAVGDFADRVKRHILEHFSLERLGCRQPVTGNMRQYLLVSAGEVTERGIH